jgi:hypothetical protein
MATHTPNDYTFDEFLLQPRLHQMRGDGLIRINISRNTLLAIIFSLLLHALIIFFALPQMQPVKSSNPPARAIEVSLAKPTPPKAIPPPPAEKPAPKLKKTSPKVITQPRAKSTFAVPDEPMPEPEKVRPVENKSDAPTDMMSYVKSKRAQRQLAEADAARQNAAAVAREVGPSAAQLRDERIEKNFQTGTNGIFEVTSLNSRHAGFAFRGWTSDYSNSRREYFEVEASTGQDIRLEVIKRMIKLIREHYQGDFSWDSQRMGRVITMSARPQDNAALENFMMREIFAPNYRSPPP